MKQKHQSQAKSNYIYLGRVTHQPLAGTWSKGTLRKIKTTSVIKYSEFKNSLKVTYKELRNWIKRKLQIYEVQFF